MIKIIANIIWFLCGGLIISLLWAILGLILCISIAGIPLGLQCFKVARLTFFPYGKKVVTDFHKHSIANTLWAILAGWWIALVYLVAAILNFITIVGFSRGLLCIKIMRLSFSPFGAQVIKTK